MLELKYRSRYISWRERKELRELYMAVPCCTISHIVTSFRKCRCRCQCCASDSDSGGAGVGVGVSVSVSATVIVSMKVSLSVCLRECVTV
jgi:hypothetical protein